MGMAKVTPPQKKIIDDILGAIKDINDDNTVPRNVKLRMQKIAEIMLKDEEVSSRVNKALYELEEISDDINMQPYTRTQIWNLGSLLETL